MREMDAETKKKVAEELAKFTDWYTARVGHPQRHGSIAELTRKETDGKQS